jgi:hypothetical protein
MLADRAQPGVQMSKARHPPTLGLIEIVG